LFVLKVEQPFEFWCIKGRRFEILLHTTVGPRYLTFFCLRVPIFN
jgi:hypothetical protein